MKKNNYKNLTPEKLEKAILERDQVIVEFKAQWSGISHIINPIIKEIAKTYEGSVDIYSIDTDGDKEISRKYGVSKVPTLMFFEHGEPIDVIIGARSKIEIINKIESIYN